MILRFKLCSLVGGAALLSAPGGEAFAPAAVVRSTNTRDGAFTSSISTARHQQQQDGPSPEFLKKMGLPEGELPPQQQMQPPPQAGQQPPPQTGAPQMQPPPQQPAQFYDANGNPVSVPMVYDATGNLVPYNPAPPPPVQPQLQPPMPHQVIPGAVPIVEPPLPPKSKGTDDPRPVGYNPDAFTMSNTADVYFAQLKQDSKVRKIARMSGDVEAANRVFADNSIREIGESWNENPYTKEKNVAEARAEIEGIVRTQVQDSEAPVITSGISYKEKLAQKKASRTGGGGVPAPPPMEPPAAVPPPEAVAPPKAEPPTVAKPAPTKVISQAPPTVGQQIPTNVVPPPPVVPSPAPPVTAVAAAPPKPLSEDVVRAKFRTAQGLLLKQRGGPGFGNGRLRAPEAQQLEDTLEVVAGILRYEAGGGAPAAAPVAKEPVAVTAPPQKASVAPAPPQPAAVPPQLDPLAGSVACVEGAVSAYKAASPAERKEAATALVGALMAAASACNKYIAENELEEHRAAMDAGPSAAVAAAANVAVGSAQTDAPMMGFPTTYAVTKREEETVAEPTQSSSPVAGSPAENTRKLEEVYNALVDARGVDGKLGLKSISGDDAMALKEKLQTMRTVLLDELNSAP
ncbi:hypothetical protein ACHAXT_002539 [Thalassiosira profunda]